jgi:hypothetical protein
VGAGYFFSHIKVYLKQIVHTSDGNLFVIQNG